MTTIRTFQNNDVQNVIQLWNATKQEPFMDTRFFLKNILLDMNFDEKGFFIAEKDGKSVGFCQAIVRRYPVDVGAPAQDECGYINMLVCLSPQDLLGELGQELLRNAETYIRSQGKKEIRVATYSPNYIHPGISVRNVHALSLLQNSGYVHSYETRAIKADLSTFAPIPDLEKLQKEREQEGFIFTRLTDNYVLPLLHFNVVHGWIHRYRRLLNETLDYEKFRLILHGEKLVGVAVYGDPYSDEGRFGPFGIDAEYQGKGLGKILLYNTLTSMKEHGICYAWAQSTPCFGAGARVYEKLGFVETDRFIAMAKKLS